MNIKFTKMHGIGNDYVYFDCIDNPDLISDPVAVAPSLSDRHFGIGGDGIVLILKDNRAEFMMRMFNSDGSEAEMCGNAIRCVAKYLCDNNYVTSNHVKIRTKAGIMPIDIIRNINGNFISAKVDMGEPELRGLFIPVNIDKEPIINEPIVLKSGKSYQITCVSMGNPHAVIFVDKITDEQIFNDGPQIECHEMFPRKTNVHFVKVLSPTSVEMRVWERGAGETLACGTGASAVTVAAKLNKLTASKIEVHLLGGNLEMEWAENNHVYMTGPATTVFTGNINI